MARVLKVINKDPDKEEKRIGLIAPGKGRLNEQEFSLVCPPEISFLITVLGVRNRELDRIMAPPLIENAAKALASAGADMIFMCGVPIVFFQPRGYEQTIISRIEKASDLPAATMPGALVESMHVLDVKHPLVITHYNERLNEEFRSFLNDSDIEPATIHSVIDHAGGKAAVEREPRSAYFDLAGKAVREASRSDGITLLGGGAFNTVELIEPLEQELGLPVTSNGLSSIWKCLRIVGYRAPIHGYGKLLTLL